MRLARFGIALMLSGCALGCDEVAWLLEEGIADETEDSPPTSLEVDREEEKLLPERPADSVARSETEVITFGSILDNREMSRAERIRAFENLDPGALQKRVAQPNVSGAPPSRPTRRDDSPTVPSDRELQAARSRVPVVMYSTTWCGVCKRAKKYFEDHRIAFTEYDVDKNVQARNEYLLLNPRRSVPTIKIGNEVVVGFSPAAVENALNAAARAGPL